ncbi:MAG TPA: hypothetical protein VFN94_10965, partial [Nitrospiria bacterium]|nr:hypothetical protein [Nitrospiria bacterium]
MPVDNDAIFESTICFDAISTVGGSLSYGPVDTAGVRGYRVRVEPLWWDASPGIGYSSQVAAGAPTLNAVAMSGTPNPRGPAYFDAPAPAGPATITLAAP